MKIPASDVQPGDVVRSLDFMDDPMFEWEVHQVVENENEMILWSIHGGRLAIGRDEDVELKRITLDITDPVKVDSTVETPST